MSEPAQIEEYYNLPFAWDKEVLWLPCIKFLTEHGVITYSQTTMSKQKNTSATLIILNCHLRNWADPNNIF